MKEREKKQKPKSLPFALAKHYPHFPFFRQHPSTCPPRQCASLAQPLHAPFLPNIDGRQSAGQTNTLIQLGTIAVQVPAQQPTWDVNLLFTDGTVHSGALVHATGTKTGTVDCASDPDLGIDGSDPDPDTDASDPEAGTIPLPTVPLGNQYGRGFDGA